jgi:hypothetical protein
VVHCFIHRLQIWIYDSPTVLLREHQLISCDYKSAKVGSL